LSIVGIPTNITMDLLPALYVESLELGVGDCAFHGLELQWFKSLCASPSEPNGITAPRFRRLDFRSAPER
jgi:hypothetical protein